MGIRPILNIVSRMKVWAMPFNTSQLGEVMNAMSMSLPLSSQNHHETRQAPTMSINNWPWRPTSRIDRQWQGPPTSMVPITRIDEWPQEPMTTIDECPPPGLMNSYDHHRPWLMNANKDPSRPSMNGHECPPWQTATEPLAPPLTNSHRCPWH